MMSFIVTEPPRRVPQHIIRAQFHAHTRIPQQERFMRLAEGAVALSHAKRPAVPSRERAVKISQFSTALNSE
jgi:hypothetical protein